MGLKEVFTGGPEVQRARQTISELEAKDHLSKRGEKDLRRAKRVSRRHFNRLAFRGGAVAAGALATGGMLLRLQREQEHQIADPEIEGEDVEVAADNAIGIFKNVYGFNIDREELGTIDLIDSANDEEGAVNTGFLAVTRKKKDGSGERIIIYKDMLEDWRHHIKGSEEVKNAGLRHILGSVMIHELVHWSALWDRSEVINRIIAESEDVKLNNSDFSLAVGEEGFFDGASIEVDSVAMETLNNVEEAEAELIGYSLNRHLPIDTITATYLEANNISIGINREVTDLHDALLKDLGFESADQAAAYLFQTRTTTGGRQKYYELVGRHFFPDENIHNQTKIALKIMTAIDKGDIELFKFLTQIEL